MPTSKPRKRTDLARLFLEPTNAVHRQYEALRAFFIEGLPGAEVARRFGYTRGASAFSSTISAISPGATTSSRRPRGPVPHRKPIPSATESSPCANKTSRSTTSAAAWPTKDTLLARPPSPRFSRTKASRGCRAGPPTNACAARGVDGNIADDWGDRSRPCDGSAMLHPTEEPASGTKPPKPPRGFRHRLK